MLRATIRAATFLAAIALVGPATASARLPTPQECAAGQGEGITLGEHVGDAGVCLSAAGHTVVYAAGNPGLPCGTIIAADQSTPAAQDPNACDTFLDLPSPDRLEFGVVLPAGYATSRRRYPVLYLLTASTQDEWPVEDPHLQDIANLGVIIVLPARGYGFYNDWYDGTHRFESLYTRTLIGQVDAHYRTIADRAHRAVAGVSKAGYGAMLFAARHPDLYAAAASFSGIVDVAAPWFRFVFTTELSQGYMTYAHPGNPLNDPIWGNPATQAVSWHAKDPTDLAGNLGGVSIYEAAGDGAPTAGELQHSGPTAALGAQEEAGVRIQSDAFDRALARAAIPHTYVRHGGTHSFYYWVPELHQWATTMMMAAFQHPAPPPAAFDYRSADASFSVWGWSFTADPGRAMEFLDITHASPAGLALTGSGLTTVTTGPLYAPHQRIVLTSRGGTRELLRADRRGRLTFVIDLGQAHRVQQYTARELALARLPGYFVTRSVTLTPLG